MWNGLYRTVEGIDEVEARAVTPTVSAGDVLICECHSSPLAASAMDAAFSSIWVDNDAAAALAALDADTAGPAHLRVLARAECSVLRAFFSANMCLQS